MSLHKRPRADLPAVTREGARSAPREDLELPRPWRLILTAGWNLAESLGLPAAGYLAGAALGGQASRHGDRDRRAVADRGGAKSGDAQRPRPAGDLSPGAHAADGLVIATGSTLVFLLQFPLANLALCVLFARTAPTRKPLVAQLATEVVGLRQPPSRHAGLDRFFQEATWLWAAIFAASAAGLAAAMAVASANVVLLLATAATVGGVAAGAFLSVLWFIRVLRRFGLHVRFIQA